MGQYYYAPKNQKYKRAKKAALKNKMLFLAPLASLAD